jgi:hypothetical protein
VSFVTVVSDALTTAASDLANLGSMINQANAAAAGSTTQILAAGQDEVSQAVAALFGARAQQYQALSSEVAAVHEQFVRALAGSAASYASTEAANASTQQTLLNAAHTNLTGANQVLNQTIDQLSSQTANGMLSQADVSNQIQLEQNVAQQIMNQDGALGSLAKLESAEGVISAHAGPFSGLVSDLFTPLNQGWYQASGNLLNADQALEGAVSGDSGVQNYGVVGAEFGVVEAAAEVVGAQIISVPVADIAIPFNIADYVASHL